MTEETLWKTSNYSDKQRGLLQIALQIWRHASQLDGGRLSKSLNVLDDVHREGLSIEVGFSLPRERVIRTLTQFIV